MFIVCNIFHIVCQSVCERDFERLAKTYYVSWRAEGNIMYLTLLGKGVHQTIKQAVSQGHLGRRQIQVICDVCLAGPETVLKCFMIFNALSCIVVIEQCSVERQLNTDNVLCDNDQSVAMQGGSDIKWYHLLCHVDDHTRLWMLFCGSAVTMSRGV